MTTQVPITYDELFHRARSLPLTGKLIYGVPSGGIFAAMIANIKHPSARIVETPEEADCFVDDIVDSGATKLRLTSQYPERPFYALIDKTDRDSHWKEIWLTMPWERAERVEGPEDNVRRILEYIGEDPSREGLRETPARVIKSYSELFAGYKQNQADVFKCFEDGACDEMVLLRDIEFNSCCEHHMLPFSGNAHIAYIPDKRIIGVSKLARLLEVYSRRLQVQERLTTQITTALDDYLKPKGSACVIEASHMCMVCRGVKKQNSVMVTSSLTGAFKNEPEARQEFMSMVWGGRTR